MLPAPIIENTLLSMDYQPSGTTFHITIPDQPIFIDSTLIKGIKISVRTMALNTIYEEQIEMFNNNNFQFNKTYTFYMKESYTVGSYYKIQVALTDYILGDTIIWGPHSNVGVIQCTNYYNTSVSIITEAQSNDESPMEVLPFMPFFGQTKSSPTDPVKFYSFTILETDYKTIIETSGKQLHNISNDIYDNDIDPITSATTSRLMSYHSWTPSIMLNPQKSYILKYEVTTVNNGTHSDTKEIAYKTNNQLQVLGVCKIVSQLDDGYIELQFKGLERFKNYVIVRSSSQDEYKKWIKVFEIKNLQESEDSLLYFKDHTIEHGVLYKYGIYQYTNNSLSQIRLLATDIFNILHTKFEHIFLSDSERQLCIKYNPKVASFKSAALENKVDTVGGQYPFIFKNSNVSYKEMSISGLISMSMDDNQNFFKSHYTHNNILDFSHNLINYTVPNLNNSALLREMWGNDKSLTAILSEETGDNCLKLKKSNNTTKMTQYLKNMDSYFEAGDYVLSGWIKNDGGRGRRLLFAFGDEAEIQYEIQESEWSASEEWHYFTFQFNIAPEQKITEVLNILVGIPNAMVPANGGTIFRHLQLEKGTHPTLWTPSKKDVERNGNLNSFLSDDFTTNLTDYNFYKEREFKIEVLNWLTNGKPKLFRSPAEGNYIVSLMNVSLTPNDTLGRMLHTFNCTAYEIDECNISNIQKHNLMNQEYFIDDT